MKLSESWTKVTLLSKIIAMALFVSLPFIGFYFGVKYQQNYQQLNLKETNQTIPISPESIDSSQYSDDSSKEIIMSVANNAFKAITQKDFKTLSKLMGKELYFSPYVFFSSQDLVKLNKDQVFNFLSDNKAYLCGFYDGSGLEINLTPQQYADEFFTDRDISNITEINFNQTKQRGNQLNNIKDEGNFSQDWVVEYYIEGTDPNLDGMDWKSIYFVIGKENESTVLKAIISDGWTI